jgi:5-methylcytosine-specific restriction endonuclease McrBC GTP-binding regulatory subunit McrB
MNLARIEYYFAEFLSIMEMPDPNEWKIDLIPDSQPGDPKHIRLGKIMIPQNVWFVGTANKDDSTFTITDKVYDRAMALEFNNRAQYFDAPYTKSINMTSEYLDSLFKKAKEEYAVSAKSIENLNRLDQFIRDKFKIAFGNRIMKHINIFVPTYMACGGTEIEGLDFMLRSKILRKFESLNLSFLKEEIEELISLLDKLYGKNTFVSSIAYLRELQKS